MELHADALAANEQVLIVDDLIATGAQQQLPSN